MKKIRCSFGPIEFETYVISCPNEARKVIRSLEEADFQVGGIDIETSKIPKYKDHDRAGLDPMLSEIRLVQIYTGKNVAVFDIRTVPLALLKNLLYSRSWYAHYAIFELSHFTHAGYPDLDIGCSKILSQMIWNAEHSPFEPEPEEKAMLEEEPDGLARFSYKGHTLEDCCGRHFGIRLDKKLQTSDWGAAELSTEQYIYAAADAVMTLKLGQKLYKKIEKYKMQKCYSLEKQMQHVVVDMQLEGMAVDWKLHEKFVNRWDEADGQATRDGYGYFGDINLNSGKQLEAWARKYFKREPKVLENWPKTPKGKLSFNEFSISKFKSHKPIEILLRHKEFGKLLSTYGESFAAKKHPVTGKIHCEFTLSETLTGRLSSRSPNLQQWPRGESRAIFTPGEGYKLVVADFSQIELRVQAEFSQDPVMIKAFKEKRDLYCELGGYFYGKKITKADEVERAFMKQTQLSFSYGMGATTFVTKASKELGRAVSMQEAERAKAVYYKRYPVYIAWCQKRRNRAEELGYVRTLLGKMRHLLPKEVFTKGPNHEVQGTSSEMIKVAMVRMRKKKVRLCNSIHDEGIGVCKIRDVEEIKHHVEDAMNGAFEYLFPNSLALHVADAHAGNNWIEAKG